MTGLMTLSSFAAGGHDVSDAKVLLCVKSVGARKKSKPPTLHSPPNTTTAESTTVFLFDHTAQASLTLWGAAATSPAPWKPHTTILLLTRPGHRSPNNSTGTAPTQTWLSLQASTTVDVDPATRDAHWLRGFAQQLLLRRRGCNPAPPVPALAAREIEQADTRVLWSLADLDGAARRAVASGTRLAGFVSAVLTEVRLVALWRRGMLACGECECGQPLFANAVAAACALCGRRGVPLRLNPQLLGPVVDETGGIAAGKLVFADEAWVELLGRGVEELLAADMEALRALEVRMTFVRVSLVVGWVGAGEDGWEGVGSVCVVGVRA
ncbi:hypothetical protein GTA08_BOTSDO03807 [Neofusicoccum parvum]|nr:hypothetical protein GTA08_BOTSDO03807 [Neofusicoccum parvum]